MRSAKPEALLPVPREIQVEVYAEKRSCMIKHCPYCEIKEAAKCRLTFFTLDKPDGGEVCQDCGAYIDLGQLNVKVNSYKEMYAGVIRIIEGIVEEFADMLEIADIDLAEYFDEEVAITVSPYEIIDRLFVSGYGGTTKRNFINALDIPDTRLAFVIQEHDEEENDD